MRKSLIISDIHLTADNAHPINQHFVEFLESQDWSQIDRLFILGDLFDVWFGDDIGLENPIQAILQLREISLKTSTQLFIQIGNRDFLIGTRLLHFLNAQKLEDIHATKLYGQEYLMLHGDLLCTDDIGYQRMRKVFHCRLVQKLFLALPARMRLNLAKKIQSKTKQQTSQKNSHIMDVNESAVSALFANYPDITQMLHGHTHKPDIHLSGDENSLKRRYVLGDWGKNTTVFEVTEMGVCVKHLPFDI